MTRASEGKYPYKASNYSNLPWQGIFYNTSMDHDHSAAMKTQRNPTANILQLMHIENKIV